MIYVSAITCFKHGERDAARDAAIHLSSRIIEHHSPERDSSSLLFPQASAWTAIHWSRLPPLPKMSPSSSCSVLGVLDAILRFNSIQWQIWFQLELHCVNFKAIPNSINYPSGHSIMNFFKNRRVQKPGKKLIIVHSFQDTEKPFLHLAQKVFWF